MVIVSQESAHEDLIDHNPLLTEHSHSNVGYEHVVDIERSDAFSTNPSNDNDIPRSSIQEHEGLSSSQPDRNPWFAMRNEELGRPRQWSSLNFGFWTSFGFLFTFSQITASAVVLALSIHEKPQTELFAWVVGYAVGCVASLPLLYWSYLQSNQGTERRPLQLNEDTSTVYDELVDCLLFALGFFFSVWFVGGSIWVFPGYSSIPEASTVYRLSVAYVILSCGGYAMPFVICTMINCIMPIFVMSDIHEGDNRIQGAKEESINALPTHKFKSKSNAVGSSAETNSQGLEEGIVAAGTEKERAISGEDSVCSICLASYVDNDVLRELPCSHFFHSKCVDRWLRINASCPLCKCAIVEGNEDPTSPR